MASFRDFLAVASSPPLSKHFRSMPSLNLEPLNINVDAGKPAAREKAGFSPMRGFPAKPRRRVSPRRSTFLSRPQMTRPLHEERGMLTSSASKLRPKFGEKPQNFPRTSDQSEARALPTKSLRSKTWVRYQHVDGNRMRERTEGSPPKLERGEDETPVVKQLATTRPGGSALWRQEQMDSREKCVKWLLGLPDNPEPYEPPRAGTLQRRWLT